MLQATTVTSAKELEQILALQRDNLIASVTPEEMKEQGFVTVSHTFDMLQQMHNLAPSIIIKDGDNVVAYALVMLREFRNLVPALEPMFDNFDSVEWNGKPLKDQSFYVMGQVCVDKAYRGQGLFDKLYQAHKDVYSGQYDVLVTEIATRNHRSLRAHERVGFKIINTHRDELDEWAVVGWDWK
jgi:GNAT superfamily N-acetyltransferase